MKILERYAENGLAEPIAIHPTFKMHLLVWGGGAFLLVGGYLAVISDELTNILIGAVGILFFGTALIFFGSAIFRGRKRGLVEFSKNGLWLSTIAAQIPWESIGPAWVNTTNHAGGKTDDVVFIVRQIDKHIADGDWIANLHLKIMRKGLEVGKGGAMDFGLKLLFQQAGSEHSFDELAAQLQHARNQAAVDPTAALLNIPVPFRLGVSPYGLAAMINECAFELTDNGA